jgi:hypothetical protein
MISCYAPDTESYVRIEYIISYEYYWFSAGRPADQKQPGVQRS